MIDLTTEKAISLDEARAILPLGRGGKRVSPSCLWRWMLKGARAPGGRLVKLEGLRIGGRWVTSREALQRFAEALTPSFEDAEPSPKPAAARRKAADRAGRQLEAMGI